MDGSQAGVSELHSLIETVIQNHGRPLESARSLPPAAYARDDFFQVEVDRIFRRDWICVGHVSQVAKDGDYFTVDLLDELLVVVRSGDVVRTLSRVCLHRWTPLVTGAGNAKRFTCPFHKWAYALDGQLLITPLMGPVEFDARTCALPSFRTEVVAGFIFVALSAEAPPLDLAGFAEHAARFRLEETFIAGSLDFDCKINWKIIAETFSEAYHHIGTHLESFQPYFPAHGSYIEDGRPGWTSGHIPAKDDLPDEALTSGFPEIADLTTLTPQERREYHFYLVYPFHVFIVMRDRAIWFCLQPLGPGRTRVQSHLLLRPEARDMPDFEERLAREMEMAVIVGAEDNDMNELQQRGVYARSAAPGRFSVLEKACWQLADYISDKIRKP